MKLKPIKLVCNRCYQEINETLKPAYFEKDLRAWVVPLCENCEESLQEEIYTANGEVEEARSDGYGKGETDAEKACKQKIKNFEKLLVEDADGLEEKEKIIKSKDQTIDRLRKRLQEYKKKG